MKLKHLPLFIACIFIVLQAEAQNISTIQGKVFDNKTPVEFANVALFANWV